MPTREGIWTRQVLFPAHGASMVRPYEIHRMKSYSPAFVMPRDDRNSQGESAFVGQGGLVGRGGTTRTHHGRSIGFTDQRSSLGSRTAVADLLVSLRHCSVLDAAVGSVTIPPRRFPAGGGARSTEGSLLPKAVPDRSQSFGTARCWSKGTGVQHKYLLRSATARDASPGRGFPAGLPTPCIPHRLPALPETCPCLETSDDRGRPPPAVPFPPHIRYDDPNALTREDR